MTNEVDGRNIKVPMRTRDIISRDGQPEGALVIEKETGKIYTYGSDVSHIGVDVGDAGLGWELYTDTDTEGSPQTLTAGQENQITLDTKAITSFSPAGVSDLWSTSTNKITPYKSGDCYLCLLYTSPSPRDGLLSRMPSSA